MATQLITQDFPALPQSFFSFTAEQVAPVQKVNRAYRDLQGLLMSQIQQEYAKTPKGSAKRQA